MSVIALITQTTFGQEKNFYPDDYKSIKAISLSGGLIGFGVGGEVRADINVSNFLITGTAGYKGYGARDSNIIVGSHTYQQVITSDCKGPIFKLGLGIRIHRNENMVTEFVATDMWMTEDAFNYYIHQRGKDENFPQLTSKYVILEVSSLPTGIFYWGPYGPTSSGALFIAGNNVYFAVKSRNMKEIAPLNKTTIMDFGPIVSSDLRQAGLMFNIILINRSFNFSMGLGAIRRINNPDVIQDPFDGDGSYKWAVPFQFTFGGTFQRFKRSSDFVKKKSSPQP